MRCKIEYVGKLRTGVPQYYCTVHKSFASDKEGHMQKECLCTNKEAFDNRLNLKDVDIRDIKIVYENILENAIPKMIIDDKEFDGILEYENCVLGYKDLGGIMLSRLNDVCLEAVKCSHCNHYHSDNGKFAYTPHRTHLCLYCGHLFRVKEKNIGNEFDFIYDIPKIKLENKRVELKDNCRIEYDLLKGTLLVNGQKCDRILLSEKEMSVVDFLNHMLEKEF